MPSFLARDITGRTVQRARKQLTARLLVGDATSILAVSGLAASIYLHRRRRLGVPGISRTRGLLLERRIIGDRQAAVDSNERRRVDLR